VIDLLLLPLQETEKMLAVGVPVTGLGKVLLEGTNRMILCAPDDGPFILTTASRPELVRSLKSEARVFRALLWVFGVAGLAYAAYVVYRNVRKSRELRLVDEHRLRRRRRSADTGNSSQTGAAADNEQTSCVICMEKSREVVVLDCGHICMCSDCALQLPSPKRCPVCRQAVARIIPTYIP
jgi:E3 ubiquitin-protein ligase MUL1